MTRITVEEVVEAYRKIGALPIRGAYRAPDFCLCPLAAVAYARDAWAPSVDDDDADEGAQGFGRMLATCLGLDWNYAHGFTMGFDLAHEGEAGPRYGLAFNQGWDDGALVAEAVFARLWGRRPKRRRWEPAPEKKPLPQALPPIDDDSIPF
jgi:hypothetical protein